jgi:regulator of cell morphogenesis and NO signaling
MHLKRRLYQIILPKKSNNKLSEKEQEDHNQLEEKLFDLKNLIIKFLPPVKRKDILENLLIELFRLEDDLEDHSRIEEKVLLPKIIHLEQTILKKS